MSRQTIARLIYGALTFVLSVVLIYHVTLSLLGYKLAIGSLWLAVLAVWYLFGESLIMILLGRFGIGGE